MRALSIAKRFPGRTTWLSTALLTTLTLTAPGAGHGLGVPTVQAAENEEEGKRRFVRGQELYVEGRYLEAAREFEAGYAAAPRPAFLLNIARAYRKAGELKKAKANFDLLITLAPEFGERQDVKDDIRDVEQELAAANKPPAPEPEPEPRPDTAPVPTDPGNFEFARPTVLTLEEEGEAEKDKGSLLSSPWFWVGTVAVVVAGGIAAAVLLRSEDGCTYELCIREP